VVGHCVGGWLAMEVAIRSTARLGSLTLVDSAGLRLEGVPRADMFICGPDELAGLLFAGDGLAWMQAWQASPAQQDIYERNRAAAAKFSWHPRLCNPKLSRWLHRIDVPTHVIWGEQDKVLPQAYGSGLKKRIAGATMTSIPGCGHMPNIERPAEFAAAVAQFIRRAAA
jgi:pimeloyl-ACP methyl ester carboxylesterase